MPQLGKVGDVVFVSACMVQTREFLENVLAADIYDVRKTHNAVFVLVERNISAVKEPT